MAKAKAGPVVTDNGNLLLDWVFEIHEIRRMMKGSVQDSEQISDRQLWTRINSELCCTAGVVDTGIFVNMAKIAYFGNADGTVAVVKQDI